MRRRVLSLGTCGKRGALRRVALERGVNPPYTHRAPRTGVCAYCCPMPTGRGDIHAPRQPGACLRAPLWRCSGKGDTAGKDRAPPVPGGSPWGGGWISPASPIPEFHHNSCPFFHPPKKKYFKKQTLAGGAEPFVSAWGRGWWAGNVQISPPDHCLLGHLGRGRRPVVCPGERVTDPAYPAAANPPPGGSGPGAPPPLSGSGGGAGPG